MKRAIWAASLLIGALACSAAMAKDSTFLKQHQAELGMTTSQSQMLAPAESPMAAPGADHWEQLSAPLHQVVSEKSYGQSGQAQGVREVAPWWR